MTHEHVITMQDNISHVLFELQLPNGGFEVSCSSGLNSASPEGISERPAYTDQCRSR